MIEPPTSRSVTTAPLVLTGVGLIAHSGEVIGLIGPNGNGKTTLLRTMYRGLAPRAGLITIDDRPVAELLLDEPTNYLDIRYQHEILQLVRGLGVTTVVVLHDLNLASRYCDRLVLLVDGTVRCTGEPAAVLTAQVLEPVYGVTVDP